MSEKQFETVQTVAVSVLVFGIVGTIATIAVQMLLF